MGPMEVPGKGDGVADMPDGHEKMNMEHMTFFWGKNVDILFSGWPGQSLGMYIFALVVVFALAVAIEWLSGSRFIKPAANRVQDALARTILHTVRVGLAYLLMLAVMSFNVGVLIAAVVGHGLGFLLFGSRLFKRDEAEELPNQRNNSNSLPPMKA